MWNTIKKSLHANNTPLTNCNYRQPFIVKITNYVNIKISVSVTYYILEIYNTDNDGGVK